MIAPGSIEGWYYNDSRMVIGDWFTLRKGDPVDIDILIGEIPGNMFAAELLVEQQGKNYRMATYDDGGQRPVLPIFKTTDINEKILPLMNIDPNIETADGPNFSVLENAPKKTPTF